MITVLKRTLQLFVFCAPLLLSSTSKAQERTNGISAHYNLLNLSNPIFSPTQVHSVGLEYQFLSNFKAEMCYGIGSRNYSTRANFYTELQSRFLGYGFGFVASKLSLGAAIRQFWVSENGVFDFTNSHSESVYLSSNTKIRTSSLEIKLSYQISVNRLYIDPILGIRLVTKYKSELPFEIRQIPGLSSLSGPMSNPFLGLNIGYQIIRNKKKT